MINRVLRRCLLSLPLCVLACATEAEQVRAGIGDYSVKYRELCVDCHGETGVSNDAAFPNLAGHSVATIYKQLQDFRTRDRNAAVMGPYLGSLSQQDMVDLATHFASLPVRAPGGGAAAASAYPAAHRLAEFGDPTRGISGCGACHTPGRMESAPPLEGQQRAYLEQQLQAFKAGTRHNDIGEQMRSVARQLSKGEIAELAAYFSDFTVDR